MPGYYMGPVTPNLDDTRSLVFISHARPEDDELTRWLCGRLTAHGYRVWADLEQLLGGDPFWTDIQQAIRAKAARFIILVTHTSVTRTGVLNELAEATDVSRQLDDPRFIIPVKADDLPWSEFPIQLKRLNGLNFSSDWTKDFGTLLQTLQKGNVPHDARHTEVARNAALLVQARQAIRTVPDHAFLNRLSVLKLPDRVRYFHSSMSAADLATVPTRTAIPCVAHDRLLLSFADMSTLQAAMPPQVELEDRYSLTLRAFLSGEATNGPAVGRQQAHNYLSAIMRGGFEGFLRNAGLVQFDRRWFVPRNWRDDNQGRYVRVDSTEHYRVLVGKAKELTWHFAISFKVYASTPRRIQLVPHVLFSSDGITPLADQKQLRRRHCKLWWNDKWRDLLLALCSELLGRADTAAISLGGLAHMTLETTPIRLRLPVSYSTELAYVPDSEEDEAEWDDNDDAEFESETPT